MVFLFILLILVLLVLTLKIKIEIHNVNFTLQEPQSELTSYVERKNNKAFSIKDNYVIKITFNTIGFLPIFSIKITSEKIKKISKKIKKLNIKSRFKSFNKDMSFTEIRKIVGNLNIKIKEFRLKTRIGLDSIMLLTYSIPILSTIISILLAKKKVKIKKQFYQIKPIYNRRKFIKC